MSFVLKDAFNAPLVAPEGSWSRRSLEQKHALSGEPPAEKQAEATWNRRAGSPFPRDDCRWRTRVPSSTRTPLPGDFRGQVTTRTSKDYVNMQRETQDKVKV